MNGFLVVIRHLYDDLPIALYATNAEAFAAAHATKESDGDDFCKLINLDATTPQSVWVFEYRDGKPVVANIVKVFEDEPEPAATN